MQKDWLVVTERSVTFSAIDHSGADGVSRNITRSGLDSMEWSSPPTDDTLRVSETADETIYADPRTTIAAEARVGTPRDGLNTAEEVKLPIVEEALRVGRREGAGGEV